MLFRWQLAQINFLKLNLIKEINIYLIEFTEVCLQVVFSKHHSAEYSFMFYIRYTWFQVILLLSYDQRFQYLYWIEQQAKTTTNHLDRTTNRY